MTTTRATAIRSLQKDQDALKHVCCNLLGEDDTAWDTDSSTLKRSLANDGVETFKSGLLSLSESDIDQLTDADSGAPLPILWRRKLKIVLACYHSTSRQKEKSISIFSITPDLFNIFRISDYDPNEPILPWNSKNTPILKTRDDEVIQWQKTIKPNSKDYKVFKDEAYWARAKESFLDTIESHGLQDLVEDPDGFVPDNKELDEKKRKWLYKILTDVIMAPSAKNIVTKHRDTRDTRVLWKELCEAMDKSMTAELKGQQISTYLSSVRLHQVGWKGTQESFILHFAEQSRLYNEIVPSAKFADETLIQFLRVCVSGTSNLSSVLNLWKTAQKASGSGGNTLTFQEYVALLQQEAQTHDGGNKFSKNPRVTHSVNQHEFVTDDYDTTEYEVNVHNVDTPLEELLVNEARSFPRNDSPPVTTTVIGPERS